MLSTVERLLQIQRIGNGTLGRVLQRNLARRIFIIRTSSRDGNTSPWNPDVGDLMEARQVDYVTNCNNEICGT